MKLYVGQPHLDYGRYHSDCMLLYWQCIVWNFLSNRLFLLKFFPASPICHYQSSHQMNDTSDKCSADARIAVADKLGVE